MRSRHLKFRRRLPSPMQLAVLALFAGAQAAHAQTAGTDSPAQATATGGGGGDTTVESIVVTATKRATSLQDTPVAVTAVSAATLQDAHVQTIQDVARLVPSFQATTQGDHGVITMTLRGIGNDSAKTEYADPEVALFVDGVYVPRAEGASALLFDLSSVEVLRGPQGTLWGRNSTVGAVNMQTNKPMLNDTSGEMQAGIGTYNRYGARGAFNVPLADNLAMRVAFVHEQHDGYVDYQPAPHPSLASQQAAWAAANTGVPFQALNPNLFVQSGPKYNAQDQTAARLSLLWRPMAELKWNISYEYFLDRGTLDMNLLQDPRPGESFWSALIQVRPYLDRTVSTVRSRVDYSINEDLNLAYIAGYSRFRGSSDFDQAGGATVPTSFTTGATYQEDRTNWSVYSTYSHELELQSAGKREVDWILGLYYASEDNGIRFDIPIFNGTQQGTVAWQGSFIQPKETVESEAAFAQATWNATDTLHLTGGVRYTYDDRKNEGGINWGWAYNPAVPQVPIDPGFNPALPGSGFNPGHNDGHYTGSKTTWLGRATYDVTNEFLGYFSISTGYKSGGLQDGGRHYQPETLTNYEVGTKSTLLGGKVRFNNAAYYEDFKDFQFGQPVTNPDGTHSFVTSNAEGAKVYGLESELAAKLTADDQLQLSVALTHTRLGHLVAGSNDYALPACPAFNIRCLDVTGHKLAHSPTFAAHLLYEHRFHLNGGASLVPRASVHFESSSWLSVFNLGPGDQQSSYTRTDLGLRYNARKSWWVDGYVQNVENSRIKTNAQNSFGPWQSQYLPPVTFGANVGIDF